MKKVLGKITGVIAICLFLYPIFKMTMSAMDRNVNLYPILMVFFAVLVAILLSKKKTKKIFEKRVDIMINPLYYG